TLGPAPASFEHIVQRQRRSAVDPCDDGVAVLKRTLKQKLASRDLEVVAHQIAVDEVTAADEHHGCAIAALILPDTLNMQSRAVGRVRGGLTRSAEGFTPGSGASRQVSTKKSGDFSFQL
ncbi:MAG: hypothetical protein QF831_04380, partial [Candidatus Thalassarchaeaceae archaeon]|nr:hypothetical protein [Candidatus Thalassarchaeaceae archaeon]